MPVMPAFSFLFSVSFNFPVGTHCKIPAAGVVLVSRSLAPRSAAIPAVVSPRTTHHRRRDRAPRPRTTRVPSQLSSREHAVILVAIDDSCTLPGVVLSLFAASSTVTECEATRPTHRHDDDRRLVSSSRARTRDRRSWILRCPPVVVPFKIFERISKDSAKLRRALADLWGGFVSATISFSFESLGTCLETRSSHSVQRMPAESILGNGKIAMPRYSVAYVPRTPGVIPGVRRGDF